MSYLTTSSLWCMVLLLVACLPQSKEQFDRTFDPITRRGLSGHHPLGEGHHPPGEGHHHDPITRRGLSGNHPPGEGHHPPGEGHHPPGEAPHPPGQGNHSQEPPAKNTPASSDSNTSPSLTPAVAGLTTSSPQSAVAGLTTPGPQSAVAGLTTPSPQSAVAGLTTPGPQSAVAGLTTPGPLPAVGAKDTTNYNVIDVSKCPGASGDGKTDTTQAFLKAWEDVCKSPTPAKFLIPKGTWLTAELEFRGPCAAPKILMELQGTLLSKPDCKAFPNGYWINIIGVDHFTLNGGGSIDAQGEEVWHTRALGEKGKPLPDSLVLAHSNNSRVESINLVNGKGFNMKVYESENVTVTNMHITSPEESPNTDGIHIGRLKNFQITDSVIGVGDDCVSIGDGSIDILVRNITCGPGHGISIGSLGRFSYETDVRNVWIENCSLTKTLFGARIKTFHDSPAIAATNITFTNLIMNDVYSPIIIDQNYAVSKPTPSKVKLSDIKFTNIRGTTWSNIAVSLNCSSSVPCQGVQLTDIDLKYTGNHTEDKITHSACEHANVQYHGVMNPPACK